MKDKVWMKNKWWFYLSIVQAVVLVCIVVSHALPTKFEAWNLLGYMEIEGKGEDIPAAGYIPDAETAKIIGAQIIRKMTGAGPFSIGGVEVKYDAENRLWLVGDTHLSGRGGIVIIEQDSGKVIWAVRTQF
ncbi:MAG: hypothetical protein FWD39_01770 [Clostridiales bacterium]|nr:hypothetical protein [Clostridiales bacterium]